MTLSTHRISADSASLRYALAKQLPALRAHGAALATDYGDLPIEPGLLAYRIADLLEQAILRELALRQREETAARRRRAAHPAPTPAADF